MSSRSRQQQIGAAGQRWVAATIAAHRAWIARDLSDDFGVDLEVELCFPEVRGEILKLQIKSSERVERAEECVKLRVERKYTTYAASCRYPLILVLVDTSTNEAWYLWLQEWLLDMVGIAELRETAQDSWVVSIPNWRTLAAGLDGGLQDIARGQGETQLLLSLLDALRAASASSNFALANGVADLLMQLGADAGAKSLQLVILESLEMAARLRGTPDGNAVATKLFALVRRYGHSMQRETVKRMVLRHDSYSRTGVNALSTLYDAHPAHARSLKLPEAFLDAEPRVAFYCAFRETPAGASPTALEDPGDFTFAGLRYERPDRHWDKLANRGPSAILDYLVPTDSRHPSTR